MLDIRNTQANTKRRIKWSRKKKLPCGGIWVCAVYVCLTLHVCLQFSVMIIQSASLHPKVGLNVQNCPQACKTWTADTHTHECTRTHTTSNNNTHTRLQAHKPSQAVWLSLGRCWTCSTLLPSANQAILGQPLCQTGLLHQKHSKETLPLSHYIFECIWIN